MKKIIGFIVVGLFLIFIVIVMLLGQVERGMGFTLISGAGIGIFVVLLTLLGFNKPVKWGKKR